MTTTTGRGRVNIHGALNLENFDAPFIEPTTVDGTSAVQLLAKIEARNPDKSLIYVIWDNAPYHKGPDVREFLARADCRIHLIQLPPYCPHLNPIERLWAVMHQFVTHNRHYLTQKQFTEAILKFFRKTIPNEWGLYTKLDTPPNFSIPVNIPKHRFCDFDNYHLLAGVTYDCHTAMWMPKVQKLKIKQIGNLILAKNTNIINDEIHSLTMWIEALAKCLVKNETLSKEDLIKHFKERQKDMPTPETIVGMGKIIVNIEKQGCSTLII